MGIAGNGILTSNDALAQPTFERHVHKDQKIKEKYIHQWHIHRGRAQLLSSNKREYD
jgi:hypothetical protein